MHFIVVRLIKQRQEWDEVQTAFLGWLLEKWS